MIAAVAHTELCASPDNQQSQETAKMRVESALSTCPTSVEALGRDPNEYESTCSCSSKSCEELTNACGYADHIREGWRVVSWIGNASQGSVACGRLGSPDSQPAGLVCDAVADWEGDQAAVHSHGHHL